VENKKTKVITDTEIDSLLDEKVKIHFNNYLEEISEFQNDAMDLISHMRTAMERIMQSERDRGIR